MYPFYYALVVSILAGLGLVCTFDLADVFNWGKTEMEMEQMKNKSAIAFLFINLISMIDCFSNFCGKVS